jgi:hypothetical protein
MHHYNHSISTTVSLYQRHGTYTTLHLIWYLSEDRRDRIAHWIDEGVADAHGVFDSGAGQGGVNYQSIFGRHANFSEESDSTTKACGKRSRDSVKNVAYC